MALSSNLVQDNGLSSRKCRVQIPPGSLAKWLASTISVSENEPIEGSALYVCDDGK